jgi:hypothetical protein
VSKLAQFKLSAKFPTKASDTLLKFYENQGQLSPYQSLVNNKLTPVKVFISEPRTGPCLGRLNFQQL